MGDGSSDPFMFVRTTTSYFLFGKQRHKRAHGVDVRGADPCADAPRPHPGQHPPDERCAHQPRQRMHVTP